jgi:hypothetical protein
VLVAAAGLLVVAVTDGNGVESDSERIQRLSQSFACPRRPVHRGSCAGDWRLICSIIP